MARIAPVLIEVRPGPVLQLVQQTLKMGNDLFEVVPEWYVSERRQLQQLLEELGETCLEHLTVQDTK